MTRSRVLPSVAVAVLLSLSTGAVQAEVVIETVTVGNLGSAGELSGAGAGGWGPDRWCGAVDYVYRIGKYEVTAGQYAEFLNAVAAEDTYGLYNTEMWSSDYGCKIERTGSSPNYSYSVGAEWADRPVNFVSWGDAARFCNWLHRGQPTGEQDPTTTEDGSYFLNGAIVRTELMAVVREEDAMWVIPSEDEWYKAAYHYNDGVTGNYYDYPTQSDTAPTAEVPPGTDMTNGSANYANVIGSPYYRTEVGAYSFKPSDSPYGTFDQGGNVGEWDEQVMDDDYIWRGVRGASYSLFADLRAAVRDIGKPTDENGRIGFRVAFVPGDCNHNGIYDDCDIDCGSVGGPCDVDGCGQGDDANGDGILDECGACCTIQGCTQTPETMCISPSKWKYNGDGTVCDEVCPAGIPTVSEWGLLAMALLVLAAGMVVLRRRRGAAA